MKRLTTLLARYSPTSWKPSMINRLKILAGLGLTFGLLITNLVVASAHDWVLRGQGPQYDGGKLHWHKSGTQIVINHSLSGHNLDAMRKARSDGFNKISILYNNEVNYHTEVGVFDVDFRSLSEPGLDPNWAGVTTPEEGLAFDTASGKYDHFKHVHARFNRKYDNDSRGQNWIQGILCQEMGHSWGLDHSDTGDCMGLGYVDGWFNRNYYYGPHNNADFYNRYRNHIGQYRAAYDSQSQPPTIRRGSTGTLFFRFKNTGTVDWRQDQNIRLGTVHPDTNQVDYNSPFYWTASWLSPNRPAQLAEDRVPPGGVGSFYITLYVPNNLAPGTYIFRVRPVADGQTWIDPQDLNVWLPVTVQ